MDKDPLRFSDSLSGKNVVLAITASISLYRMPDIIRDLRREGANVRVGMSRETSELISPEVMRWASENDVVTRITGDIEHINEFIGSSDDTMLLVCPASYNFIGKAASGIADDVPSLFFSFALGNGNPVVIAPVMHEGMMVNPINKGNIEKLEKAGVSIIPPRLQSEKAKISESDKIVDYVSRAFHGNLLKGKRILILGGRGEESIDPVRNLTNSGTGLTASWLLRNAFRLGAGHIAFIGNTQYGVQDYVHFVPARYMEEFEKAVESELSGEAFHAVINLASLPDFELEKKFNDKIDSTNPLDLHFTPKKKLNRDIRKHHSGFLVVFRLARESNVEEIRESFKTVEPDVIMFNPYSDRTVPFGSVNNEYIAVLRKSELKMGKLSKPEMTLQLLKIISEEIG